MFDESGRFIIEEYSRKNAFSSFLPGVAGEMGIPIWCFYVNRGQGVCSFGTLDKEHPIMEFSPAHVAYQEVSTKGFRTFVKANGEYLEPFAPTLPGAAMHIGMNDFGLSQDLGPLSFEVEYFTLPEEPVGALMRELTVKNISDSPVTLELLDGMPAMLTYGTSSNIMKVMTQTHKAWMQVEDVESRLPYYRLRASSEDTSEIKEIKEGHFAIGFDEDGGLLPLIADPALVFGYNLSLSEATAFKTVPLSALLGATQMTSNNVPTAFFAASRKLAPGESLTLREMYGMAAEKSLVKYAASRLSPPGAFEKKRERARALTEEITSRIATKTADPVFDAYCRQTYLDNILRGGYPLTLGGKVFYVYSRKHGDIERDYNFFTMLPEYYSQGNANFRDINQNRRSDPLFSPFVGEHNIKLFMDLIQLDGYNPLVIERATFTLPEEEREAVAERFSPAVREALQKPFTPGGLLTLLEKEGDPDPKGSMEYAVSKAESDINTSFGEGYWTDHWTYNLDLIESFLAVYPEREESLLYDDGTYRYYESRATVNPRSQRYTLTDKGIRQYGGVTPRKAEREFAGVNYGKGEDYRTNLMSKLIVLAMNKFSCLDSLGMGIEMEAGKPGWYDALNGLPGLLGSSIAESCELVRLIDYIENALMRFGRGVKIPRGCADFISGIEERLKDLNSGAITNFEYWDAVNDLKEAYRQKTSSGIDGEEEELSAEDALKILGGWKAVLKEGIERSRSYTGGIPPCYFTYEVTDYEIAGGAVKPLAMRESPLPLFLEGAVRYMKMPGARLSPEHLHTAVTASPLFDKELGMYKVNESLADSSFELGRCRAFTPGWLENESVWLHMEYKYLLGLLREGLYEDFFSAFRKCAVPFLSPESYGRSPLENSSFIASSANPNPALRGKGFVARLSGSTAEFMEIWQKMMFGANPFTIKDGELNFTPSPALPSYLVGSGGVEATLLGSTRVRYRTSKALIPGKYQVSEIVLHFKNGEVRRHWGSVRGADALALRDGKVETVDVSF